MNDIETAAQKAQAAAEAEKEKEKGEAKDLWRQYTDAVSRGTEDAFLASLNYGSGLEGFAQLYDDIQATLGESEFETLISETSPESAAVIWAPDAVSHPAGYYVDPDDYNSDEEYNKALLEGLRHNMQNGHSDAFLLENGYSSGAGGMMALNSDVEEALGKAGFHDFVDQLNAEQTQKEQSIAALSGMDDLPIMKDVEETYQEEQRILETPIYELSLDELERRKNIELRALEDEIDQQMDDEIANIPIERERLKTGYIELFNANEATRQEYISIYGNTTAEEFAEAMLIFWEEDKETNIREKYGQVFEEGKAKVEEEYAPYNIIAEIGFSELWKIRDTLRESNVKDVFGKVLDGQNLVNIDPQHTNVQLIYVNDVNDSRLLFNDTVASFESEKHRDAAMDRFAYSTILSVPIPGGGVLNDIFGAVGLTGDAYQMFNEGRIELSEAMLVNAGKYYLRYDICFHDDIPNHTLKDYVTILVETNKNGEIAEQPLVYAYDRSLDLYINPNTGENQKGWKTNYYKYSNKRS
jgi:hypothetical protein